MSPPADRRAHVRSDVGGRLRGILELAEPPARVMNISCTGALIEASMPTAVGSLRSLQLTVEGQPVRVEACVRRLTTVAENPQGPYAIGVEFVSPPEDLTVLVASLTGVEETD